ncbi:hypothetical protein LCGC14_0455070 [marine sediment metagenome]|uniref:Uncharacterized protein n=1 Tax=marine sediment metagenome TaxID=412755 RepID=A0A0F9VQI9_9ZZZZ
MNMLKEPGRLSRIWQAGEHGLVGVDATAILLEDKDFEISGTNAVDGNCTYDPERGLKLTTQSAAADQVALLPAAGVDNISWFREITWGTDQETHFEALIETQVLEATGIIVAGLLLTFPATFAKGDDADRVLFNYEQATDTNWMIAVNIGSTDLDIDTGVVVTASTVYHFRIEIDRSRRAYCYINDELVYVSTALTDAVDFLPAVAIEEGSTNPQVVAVQAIGMSRKAGA